MNDAAGALIFHSSGRARHGRLSDRPAVRALAPRLPSRWWRVCSR